MVTRDNNSVKGKVISLFALATGSSIEEADVSAKLWNIGDVIESRRYGTEYVIVGRLRNEWEVITADGEARTSIFEDNKWFYHGRQPAWTPEQVEKLKADFWTAKQRRDAEAAAERARLEALPVRTHYTYEGVDFPVTQSEPGSYWIDGAEVSKGIKRLLTRKFPGVKFSVRYRTYSGGSSVDIEWTDGPPGKIVEALTDPLEGARFNISEDLQEYLKIDGGDGVTIHSGVDYISCRRKLSDAARAHVAAYVKAKFGEPEPGDLKSQNFFERETNYAASRLAVPPNGDMFFVALK